MTSYLVALAIVALVLTMLIGMLADTDALIEQVRREAELDELWDDQP